MSIVAVVGVRGLRVERMCCCVLVLLLFTSRGRRAQGGFCGGLQKSFGYRDGQTSTVLSAKRTANCSLPSRMPALFLRCLLPPSLLLHRHPAPAGCPRARAPLHAPAALAPGSSRSCHRHA